MNASGINNFINNLIAHNVLSLHLTRDNINRKEIIQGTDVPILGEIGFMTDSHKIHALLISGMCSKHLELMISHLYSTHFTHPDGLPHIFPESLLHQTPLLLIH